MFIDYFRERHWGEGGRNIETSKHLSVVKTSIGCLLAQADLRMNLQPFGAQGNAQPTESLGQGTMHNLFNSGIHSSHIK